MSERFRDYLRIALIVGVLAAAYAVVSYANNYSLSVISSSAPSIMVSESSKATAVPDVASFTFQVITEGDTNVGALQKTNSEKTNAVIDFVKGEGVAAADIKTLNYAISPRYQTYACNNGLYSAAVMVTACPPAEIVGYSINQSVEVKVRDFEKIGSLLGGIVKNGANSVSSLAFKIDDLTEIQNQARAEAIQKARIKAEKLAKDAGFRLGHLLSFNEDTPYYPVFYGKDSVMGMGGAPAATVPQVEPGSQEVTVTVNLRYEIRN